MVITNHFSCYCGCFLIAIHSFGKHWLSIKCNKPWGIEGSYNPPQEDHSLRDHDLEPRSQIQVMNYIVTLHSFKILISY